MLFMQGRLGGQSPESPAAVARDLFVILLIVVMIVGAATGSALVVGLSGLAFVVTITARLWAALALQDLNYSIVSDTTHAVIGDEIEITLNVENRKPLPLPWLRISEFIPQGVEVVGREDDFIDYMYGTPIHETVSLGRYERLRRKHKLRALNRGHYNFGPSEISSGDLFGLYVRTKKVDRHKWSLIVYPEIVSLPELDLKAARPIGDTKSPVPLWRDPTRPAGIREYRPGDAVKSIDWKSSARRGELFVRVYDPSVSMQAVVLTEGTITDKPWEGFRLDVLEAVASCAASVAQRSADLGFKTGLIVNSTLSLGGRNVVHPASGAGQLSSILESLAMMRPVTMAPLHELAETDGRDAIPAGATVVLVAGLFRERTVAYVSDLARRGHPVIAIWVGRGKPPNVPGLTTLDYRDRFGMLEEDQSSDSEFKRPHRPGGVND